MENVLELRTFVGSPVKYKGYELVIAEVGKSHSRLMERVSGQTAVITNERLRGLILKANAVL